MTDAEAQAAASALPWMPGCAEFDLDWTDWKPTGHDRIVLLREGQTFETWMTQPETGNGRWFAIQAVVYPDWICLPCGDRHGRWVTGRVVSVRHGHRCGWCGARDAPVTNPGDFDWPSAPGGPQ